MPISYPTIDDLTQEAIAEVRQRLPELDPTVLGSFIEAFVRAQVLLGRSLVNVQKALQKQLFPQTATGEFLDLWGEYEGLNRLPESSAAGTISVTGATGVGIVSIGTQWTGANDIVYEATSSGSIVTRNFAVDSITRVSTTATATTSSDHLLATGQSVVISGAVQAEYNGTFTIAVTSPTTFTYAVTGSPATPATGTIVYTTEHITISVVALTSGSSSNLSSGAVLTINSSINGVDDDALVQVGGLTGGAAEELDDAYRDRILLSRSIQQGVFTADQIRLAALGLTGNTRITVVEPENTIFGLIDGYAVEGEIAAASPARYVSVASGGSVDIGGDITVSCWLKLVPDPDTTIWRVIMHKSNTSYSNGWCLLFDQNTRKIKFGNTVGGFAEFTAPLTLDGQWIQITCVLTSSSSKLFINGTQQQIVGGYVLADSGTNLYMLGNPGIAKSTMASHLDEVRVFSSALTDDEVLTLYQRNTAPVATLEGHWSFNEGTGTTSSDLSGNGNTATLATSAMWVVGPGQNMPGMIPAPGQVVVYVLRDNDPSIIPSQTILDATKALVIANGKKPAHMSDADVFVLAPGSETVDFTFTQITPDTTSMRNAITAQLTAFFQDDVELGQTITEASYLGSIANTFDTVASTQLTSFVLTAPSGDVVVGSGSIGVLGTITFP